MIQFPNIIRVGARCAPKYVIATCFVLLLAFTVRVNALNIDFNWSLFKPATSTNALFDVVKSLEPAANNQMKTVATFHDDPPPTSVTFTTLTTCGGGGVYEFFLNGTSLGTQGYLASSGCQCDPPPQVFTVNNAPLLAGAWNDHGTNTFSFTKSAGTPYFAWVSVTSNFPNRSVRAYYDEGGGDATELNLCNAGYTPNAYNQQLGFIYYRDADGDGFGDPRVNISTFDSNPPAGYVLDKTDCNDSDASIPSVNACPVPPSLLCSTSSSWCTPALMSTVLPGWTVTRWSPAQFLAASVDDFKQFKVIYLGDNTGGETGARNTYGAAITGRAVITGQHYEHCNTAGTAICNTFKDSAEWVGAGSGTGLLVSTQPNSSTCASWIPTIAPFNGITYASCGGGYDIVRVDDPAHATMATSTNANLSNYGNSAHSIFNTIGGFTSVASVCDRSGNLPSGANPTAQCTAIGGTMRPHMLVYSFAVADQDGDSVPDATDNCPTVSNASQLDANGNGVGDACESAPTITISPATSTISPGSSVTFTTVAADSDNSLSSLTYEWRINGIIQAGRTGASETFSFSADSTVRVTVRDPGALSGFSEASVDVITQQSSSTVLTFEGGPYVYRGTPFTATANVTGGSGALNQSVTVVYSGDCTNVTVANGCTATATYAGDSSYTGSSDTKSITIVKAPVTATAGNGSNVYDGVTHSPSACVVSGDYTGGLTCSNSPATVGPNVGDTDVTPVTSGNDLANFTVTNVNGTYTISKATPTITWANPADITYGTALGNNELNAAASFHNSPLSGSFDYTPAAGTIFTVGANRPLSVNFTPSDTTNFNSTSASVSINVLQAPLTIKADDKTRIYGGDPVAFTVTTNGFVNGDTMNSLGGALEFNFADSPNKPAGAYAITPSGLTSNNYAVAFQNGTLTVDKAALTVTANSANKTYGAVNPVFTGTITGIQNSENITADYTTNATSTSLVGNYDIVPTLSGATLSNYQITANNGVLTVDKAALSITADDKSKTYGDSTVAFTVSYSGFVNGDDSSTLGGSLAFNFADTPTTSAGSHVLKPSGLTSPNYAISYADGTLTVNGRQLIVNPADKTRVYGTANPALDGGIIGIQNGDNITASYLTTAVETSNVGDYPITATLSDPDGKLVNYVPALNTGTLSVTPAALTVIADDKSRQYGTANPAFTGSVSGIQNGEAITAAYSTAATSASDVGTYAIVPALSGTTLSNYNVTPTNGALTITKAAQAISWNNPADIVYGTQLGAAQLNAGVSVVGPAAHGAVTYMPASGTILNAGNNQILSVSIAGTNNYEPASASVAINVAKAPSAVTVSAPAFIAQGGNVMLSGVLTGVANAPLGNQPVTLSIGSGAGLQSCAATTTASGAASCIISSINQLLGPNLPINSGFAGNSNYLPSSGSTTTLVFAYAATNGGSFVIGDKNSAVGQNVTFWGSQWANINSLTGGSTPNSFKGFANRSTTMSASCGATWTTDPGNSSTPPATVPAYMAVIVSSSITQSGSTISGNSPKVVIVRTNGGYQPNSGSAGTGTVLGVLCQ